MASIVNDGNGRKRILFVAPDGIRKPVRLGKASDKQAEAVKVLVERLQAAQVTGVLDKDTAVRVRELDDKLHARLAAAGLVEPRQSMTLAGWLESYLDGRKAELKPDSLRKLRNTRDSLLKHFKPELPLRKMTPQQASEWRAGLDETLSVASAKTMCGNAKTIFAEAVRRKLMPENPFLHLRSGSTASKYTRYITPDETARFIDAIPESDSEWRLMFGLARYAGLRVPSESHLLTLADVDWERGRLTVRSPKTEHHEGHEQRVVPIIPKLMQLLQARYEHMPEGEARLVTITGGWILRRARRFATAAKVDLWERLWQTLRASCEKEWAMTFPQYAVSKWIGHSITVSGKHYANAVPDELFDKAAQKAAQYPPAKSRTKSRDESGPPRHSQETALCGAESSGEWVSEGTRTPDPEIVNPCQDKTGDTPEQGCCSGRCTPFAPDPDLARVVAAWAGLSAEQRRVVLAMIG